MRPLLLLVSCHTDRVLLSILLVLNLAAVILVHLSVRIAFSSSTGPIADHPLFVQIATIAQNASYITQVSEPCVACHQC